MYGEVEGHIDELTRFTDCRDLRFRAGVHANELYWNSEPRLSHFFHGNSPVAFNRSSPDATSQSEPANCLPSTHCIPGHLTLPTYPQLSYTSLFNQASPTRCQQTSHQPQATRHTPPHSAEEPTASPALGGVKRKWEHVYQEDESSHTTEEVGVPMPDHLGPAFRRSPVSAGEEEVPCPVPPLFFPSSNTPISTPTLLTLPPAPSSVSTLLHGHQQRSPPVHCPAASPRPSRKNPWRDTLVSRHCQDATRLCGVSEEMLRHWRNPDFLRVTTLGVEINRWPPDPTSIARQFQFMLEEDGPDIFFIMSIRGKIEYVSPNVRKNLGFSCDSLPGTMFQDLLHPGDARVAKDSLKESQNLPHGKTTRFLVRALTPSGAYVFLDFLGRFVAQANQRRRTIVVGSARCQEIPILRWGMLAMGDGVTFKQRRSSNRGSVMQAQEFWMSISYQSMVILSIAADVKDVLGWSPGTWTGRHFRHLLADGDDTISSILADLCASQANHAKLFAGRCSMIAREGHIVAMVLNVFRPQRNPAIFSATDPPGHIPRAPLLVQARLEDAKAHSLIPSFSGDMAEMLGEDIFIDLHLGDKRSLEKVAKDLIDENEKLRRDITQLDSVILNGIGTRL
ncbi:hypothetical protein BKA70DRAFT_1438679 [Coprinopsis sp. MPI-PUGE-AT-0042]|nr:hypothetical protein BKA70DRAFT_1438679 [Coprinopsis sp. MPI-PUGE-AT-0042]